MKKIGIIGTHGTGKTTICHDLVSALKKQDKNAEFLGEIAREAERVGFKLNQDTTLGAQKWILYTQMAREEEFENSGKTDYLVCDRCFDNYIYLLLKFGKDPHFVFYFFRLILISQISLHIHGISSA